MPEIDREFLKDVAPYILANTPKIYVAVCCAQTLVLSKPALPCGGCGKPVDYSEMDGAAVEAL